MTKRREDPNVDDRPLIESFPEESFLRKTKRSENVDRRNNTRNSFSQIPHLL